MENQPEKRYLHAGSAQNFENGLFKWYGRGRKEVLLPSLKMADRMQRKNCVPFFTQLFSPPSTTWPKPPNCLTLS